MKLHELTGIKQAQLDHGEIDDLGDIEALLDTYGYELIGQGSSGYVFVSPSSKFILKVYSPNDRGYTTFLNYVMANQSNPHLPKLRGKPFKFDKNGGWIAVRMEWLNPITYHSDEYFDTFVDYTDYIVRSPRMGYNEFSRPMQDWIDEHQDYYDTLKSLSKVWGEWDIHVENIMQRNDGTMVLIDPFR